MEIERVFLPPVLKNQYESPLEDHLLKNFDLNKHLLEIQGKHLDQTLKSHIDHLPGVFMI